MAKKQRMTKEDASRIQSNEDKQGENKTKQRPFKARAQRAATKNQET
ncbi:hypothetical protein [Marinobacter zhejiangensis]|uniref:Uncharacterized protein n=1 Tax=Marinobacter zhejiangensis TaxID=488535 RepID=A0A1I4TM61_9GAMM|nr:hypothetical protein [Marinobacter zhejiangensis]SFM77713.1 hypothetical protein SAMN04487963_3660 [Marinobacter zhejiangensis]